MNLDMKYTLNAGVENLQKWRNRYSEEVYPEKIALNIFYRKHTLNFMFHEVLKCFEKTLFGSQKKRWDDLDQGFDYLQGVYRQTAKIKTEDALPKLIKNTTLPVGNTNYEMFTPLILKAKNGDPKMVAELETNYLYYYLTDDAILVWAALGGTGKSKLDALGHISGLKVETGDMKTYQDIENIIGQLCIAPYLEKTYQPLPPL